MKSLKQIQLEAIDQRLQECNGNKTQAANSLGITIRSLYNFINAHEPLAKYRGTGTRGRPPGVRNHQKDSGDFPRIYPQDHTAAAVEAHMRETGRLPKGEGQ